MSKNIIQLNQDLISQGFNSLILNSLEETLNTLLNHKAEDLVIQASMKGLKI